MTHKNSEFPLVLNLDCYDDVDLLFDTDCLAPFDQNCLEFLTQLSAKLMVRNHAKDFPELVALGFWLRKANIQQIRDHWEYVTQKDQFYIIAKPLGNVVHFCPANVDSMFIYSWICSLLVGNNNIVRVSGHSTPEQRILLDIVSHLLALPKFHELAKRNSFCTWRHENEQISKHICSQVDARVIWGGNDTVNKIRAFATRPRCRDITFADRFSVCVVNADTLNSNTTKAFCEHLWRDIKPYQQAACSSPKVLVWCGKNKIAKASVLANLQDLASKEARTDSTSMNHLVTSQLLKSNSPDNQAIQFQGVTVQHIDNLHQCYLEWHPGEYYLYEYQVFDINDLFRKLPPSCQTVSHFGFDTETLYSAISQIGISGVDRVVPVGQALNFSEIWDGYDLLAQLSRQVQLVG